MNVRLHAGQTRTREVPATPADTVPRMRRTGGIVMVLTLALAACGDDDDSASSTTAAATDETTTTVSSAPSTSAPATTAPATTVPSTTEPATTAPSTTEVSTTAPATSEPTGWTAAPHPEAALAAAALLTLGDLPEGWTHEPYAPESDLDDPETSALIAECAGVDASLISSQVLGDTKAKSGEFESADGTAGIEHTTGLAVDEATAIAAIEALSNEALPDCYVEAISQQLEQSSSDPANSLPEGVVITDVRLQSVPMTNIVPEDEGVWLTGGISFELDGQAIETYVDLIWLREGRALTQVELNGNSVEFPSDLLDPVMTRVQEKLSELAASA